MISADGVAGAGYYTGGGGSVSRDDGARNYYTGAVGSVNAPGWWSGGLAEQLGLTGAVKPADMVSVFDNFLAPDGSPIGSGARTYRSVEEILAERLAREPDALPERVAQIRVEAERASRASSHGTDLTYSPMKSVTLAHASAWRAAVEYERAGDLKRAARFGSLKGSIEEYLVAANQVALDEIARTATTRQGAGYGHAVVWVPVDGVLVASFLQHESRALDPQLHVHNAHLNRAIRSTDHEIRALDEKDLRAQGMAAGVMADRALAEMLGAAGLRMEMRPDGVTRELVSVSRDMVDVFSQRHAAVGRVARPLIARLEEERGRELTVTERSHINQWATLATRGAKTKDLDVDQLLDHWQERITDELGTGLVPLAERLLSASERGPVARDGTFSPEAVIAQAWAAASEKTAAVTYPALMLEVDKALGLTGKSPQESVELLRQVTDEAVRAPGVVQVAGNPGVVPPADLVAGSLVRPSSAKWAAPETMEQENLIRLAAIERGALSVDVNVATAWLDADSRDLGPDQRAAVLGIVTGDARVAQIVGPAGTGKSYVAGVIADLWQDLAGGDVHGLTTSQGAAQVLAEDGVPNTANLAAWGWSQVFLEAGNPREQDHQNAIGPRDLVFIDESSMVKASVARQVLDSARSAGARVVPMGDHRQHGTPGPGGVMGLVDGHAETYTLTDVRRFDEQWERAASLGLRDGSLDALREYDTHGRLLGFDTMREAIDASARATAADRLAGLDSVAIARTNDTAYQIANAVRDVLVAAGVVEADGVPLARSGGVAGIGDEVMTRQIDGGLNVVNRERFTVIGTGDDGSLSVRAADGSLREMPAAYVAQHVHHAYAATGHAFQGKTIDTAHPVFDGLERGTDAYPDLTRGRSRNTAYVVLGRDDSGRLATATERGGELRVTAPEARPSALAVMADVLERDDEERAATVELEEDARHLASMRTIVERLELAAGAACRARLNSDLDRLVEQGVLSVDIRASLASDQSTEHLSRVCRAVEQAGHDPTVALREAVEARTLDDPKIKSVAQVVAGRITDAVDVKTPRAGLGDIPSGIPAAHAEHLAVLHGQAQERARELGSQVAVDLPSWAVKELGPVPTDAMERLEWESRAGAVAAFREAAARVEDTRTLGGAPGLAQLELRAAWSTAWEALGRPADTRVEAAMSDGALRARVAAWEREQAWAPPHADASLRAAELDAEQARHEATLARAMGDEVAAQEWESVAEERGAVARGMAYIAEARGEWAANTSVTQDLAERAGAELRDRGLEPGAEHDRTSAQEWLAHQREVDARDEAVRDVTELDVPLADQAVDSAEDAVESGATGVSGETLGSAHSPEQSVHHVSAGLERIGDVSEDGPVAGGGAPVEVGAREPDEAGQVRADPAESVGSAEPEAASPPVDTANTTPGNVDAAEHDEAVDRGLPTGEVAEDNVVSSEDSAPVDDSDMRAGQSEAAHPTESNENPSHVEAPMAPSDVELDALVHVAREASERVTDRESEESARVAWEDEQDAAAQDNGLVAELAAPDLVDA